MTGDIVLIDFVIDTLIGTGVLIAAALLLRRPVARWFGPRAAYALWMLPLLRLAMPPVVLPAWMRPAQAPVADAAVAAPDAQVPLFADRVPTPVDTVSGITAHANTMPMGDPAPVWIATDTLVAGAVFVWLAVAVAFLAWRWSSYRAMRAMLLKGARPVGEWEDIRLVETNAVAAPIAFGVFDKVIAMPIGFMADIDSTGRDLAIAHEIAHHRGHDLLANIAAQPLLALHWFNPIAWAGWRAMRRDQEAACDARVMDSHADEGRDTATRAHYGSVIAASAREQNLAPALNMAAPMAGFREIGPLLGEKAIVHRLRSLAMTPSRLRRRTGLFIIGAGACFALPLTASISYAEAEAQVTQVPLPPSAPAAPQPPEAPLPPEAPEPPQPPEHGVYSDGEHQWVVKTDGADGEADRWAIEIERELAEAEADMAEGQAEIRREIRMIRSDKDLSPEERARIEKEMERAHAEMDRARVEIRRSSRDAARHAAEAARVAALAPEVTESVSADGKVRTIKMVRRTEDGKKIVQEHVIDEGQIERTAMLAAISGIEAAKTAILASGALSAEDRAEVMAELDSELAELRAEMAAEAK